MPRWTRLSRLRQAGFIRQIEPWKKATGPRTARGKAIVARNALRHARYAVATQRIRRAIRCYCGLIDILSMRIRRFERAVIRAENRMRRSMALRDRPVSPWSDAASPGQGGARSSPHPVL